jgi:hypothetical protein
MEDRQTHEFLAFTRGDSQSCMLELECFTLFLNERTQEVFIGDKSYHFLM